MIYSLSGAIDGSNTVFTTSTAFATGSAHLVVNGRIFPVDDSTYGITEDSTTQITVVTAPVVGDVLELLAEPNLATIPVTVVGGMTLTRLRVRVREIMKLPNQNDVDEGDPAKSTITSMINEACQRRYAQLVTSYPFRFITKSSPLTYTGLSEFVSLPTGAPGRMVSMVRALPQSVTTSIESYTLQPASIAELDTYTFYGMPIVYVIDMVNSSIWLRPIPQYSTTLFLHYVAAIPLLADDTDMPSWCPAEFHQLFAYDTAAMYLQEAGDDNAAAIQARADAIYESLKIFVERNYQDTRFKQRSRQLF